MDEDTKDTVAVVAVSSVYMLSMFFVLSEDFERGLIAGGMWVVGVVCGLLLYNLIRWLRRKL